MPTTPFCGLLCSRNPSGVPPRRTGRVDAIAVRLIYRLGWRVSLLWAAPRVLRWHGAGGSICACNMQERLPPAGRASRHRLLPPTLHGSGGNVMNFRSSDFEGLESTPAFE